MMAAAYRGVLIVAEIVGWAGDDSGAGLVECRFTDALGATHRFIGASTRFTRDEIDAGSRYPMPGQIACEILARRLVDGRELVQVDTEIEHGDLTSTEGVSWFMVAPEQLVSSDDAGGARRLP